MVLVSYLAKVIRDVSIHLASSKTVGLVTIPGYLFVNLWLDSLWGIETQQVSFAEVNYVLVNELYDQFLQATLNEIQAFTGRDSITDIFGEASG